MNLFRRAAAGEAGDADRARMLFDLGDAQMWAGGPASAFDAFDEAGRLAAVVGDRSLALLAGIRRSAAMMLTEPHAKPTDVFRSELEEAVHVFEQAGDDAALSTVWTELAGIEWMPCRYDRAAIAAGRAIDHARRSGDERLLAGALLIRIIAAVHGSTSPEDGIRLLDELGPELSRSRQMEAITLVARAFHQGLRGSLPEARRMFADSIEVSRSLGLRFDLAAAHEALGHLERYAGDLTASERAFRENYDLLDELGDERHKSTAAANLALALSYLERFDEAEPYADIAVRVAAEDDLARKPPAVRHAHSCSRRVASLTRQIVWRARL